MPNFVIHKSRYRLNLFRLTTILIRTVLAIQNYVGYTGLTTILLNIPYRTEEIMKQIIGPKQSALLIF